MSSDSGPTNQTNCAAWRDCVTREAPKFYPSPPASHPVDPGENFDEHIVQTVVSQSEVLGWFYNPNTTPKDKERVVVCLRGTGQELH